MLAVRLFILNIIILITFSGIAYIFFNPASLVPSLHDINIAEVISSPLEENEIKLLFLKEIIGSELILTRCAIYFVSFLLSMITIILLSENKDQIQTVFDRLDKIPLGFILKYFLNRALLGNRGYKIFLIYVALILLMLSTVSLFIGLLKCYAVLIYIF